LTTPKDDAAIGKLVKGIHDLAGRLNRKVNLMEVCGTHTMAISRHGIRKLLPENVNLISGPGCPVCVTPSAAVDAMVALARKPDVTVATFGDMIRVPGSESSLELEKANGSDVRIVASPMDALFIAEKESDRKVVFLGIGFETTVPGVAATIVAAKERGVANFSVLSVHKVIPPAMSLLMESDDVAIDGFLCPGHVSVIIGSDAYIPIAENYKVPCVVAGFEAGDVLESVYLLIRQILDGRNEVENQYVRVVKAEGNPTARKIVDQVFEVCDAEWRGVGVIPKTGLSIRKRYASFCSLHIFHMNMGESVEPKGCLCGTVLRGAAKPTDCKLFRNRCTPAAPVGPCMVSSEGTCAAYFKYHIE